MAIPFVTIELDKTYQLRFGMGAAATFEKISGKTLTDLGRQLAIGNIPVLALSQALLSMLWRENKGLKLEDVWNLVDDNVDDVSYVIGKVAEAIGHAFPAGEADDPNAPPTANE